jgi:hypothetical protein
LLCLRMVAAAKDGRVELAQNFVAEANQLNRARTGSKAFIVGELLLRPEGVTRAEACAATGWPSISLPQQAEACGLSFTTQRIGREVRYYARAAQASVPTVATLAGLMDAIGASDAERNYFNRRTANLSGEAAWAA